MDTSERSNTMPTKNSFVSGAITEVNKSGAASEIPPSESATAATTSPTTAAQSGQALAVAPYSVWSKRRKQTVVLSASFGAVFSTLTATTYLPALDVISKDFGVSVSKINLTVTIYLIFQGITPILLGTFADRMGRRPAYLVCFVLFGAANIGLALAPSYCSLLGLRCLQAAGISGTQTLCQAIVADITTSAERGQYIGFITLSAILGPSLGPVIGGALTDSLGWRSIFWFLAICAGVIFVLVLFFFPETCRPIVGDGSVVPPESNQTLLQLVQNRQTSKSRNTPEPMTRQDPGGEGKDSGRGFALKGLFASLRLLWNVELGLLLFYGGVVYSGIMAISAALPSQFTEIYYLNSLEIGLVYLPMAFGSVIGVYAMGRLLNWNYRRHAANVGIPFDEKTQADMIDFPIERARLELGLPLLLVTSCIIISWGWALYRRVSIAVPCVLSFLLGVFYIGLTQIFNILITDLYRNQAATAVAANWFARCALAALMTAVIQPMILAVGSGWAFTILGLFYMIFSPIMFLIMWKGQQWRRAQRDKEERKKATRMAEEEEQNVGMVSRTPAKSG